MKYPASLPTLKQAFLILDGLNLFLTNPSIELTLVRDGEPTKFRLSGTHRLFVLRETPQENKRVSYISDVLQPSVGTREDLQDERILGISWVDDGIPS